MNILLVEDEPNVASLLHKCLSEKSHRIGIATNGQMGLDLILSQNYDLVLLDIMLPDKSGLEILEELQQAKNQTPIILLTALDTTETVVKGLNLGADDYIVKPFKIDELLARVNAVSRRKLKSETSTEEKERKIIFNNIAIDDGAKRVFKDKVEIKLTATEYKLLKVLIENNNKVLSREQILEKVWGVEYDLGTNVVDVYINYLRKKLKDNSEDRLIQTVIGMGYVVR
ncbi:response regulator transcription factor [Salegentibacter sp. JZCK2]|uniref:response regulator transcription factor n=1 Tax=Salegentibacter tibetensis TaxID=2873600 RepID=UPI001CCEBBCC|nr:response regulator transcription factor [Salegentibacter tibetensis]MBZ9729001.1 response regulator transcription factor [Salegentibacter tibetensis]